MYQIIKPTSDDFDELTCLWEASVRATHHFIPGEIHSEVLSKRVMALTLAERGMSAADIADIVKVSVKLVQEWLGVWAW